MSGPSRYGTGRRPHPDARFFTAEYHRAQLSVVLALLLLAGTAVYLVVQEQQQTWASARENVLDMALSLDTSITGLLEQSAFSLRGIVADVSQRPGSPHEPKQAMAALRDAARFDPISSYLGLRTADAGILAVDQMGEPVVSPDILRTIAQALKPHGMGLDVSYLVQFPAKDEWYLPITMTFRTSVDGPKVAFALVPARRLVASTDTLRLIPGSFVRLVTTDGRQLVSYAPGSDSFEALRGSVSQQAL